MTVLRQTAPSPRQADVLRLLASGHTIRGIAEELCLSVKTVYAHCRILRRKVGAKNMHELVRYAALRRLQSSEQEAGR